jgi:hypothetical protein
MVCSEHKDLPKSTIRIFRERRQAEKSGEKVPAMSQRQIKALVAGKVAKAKSQANATVKAASKPKAKVKATMKTKVKAKVKAPAKDKAVVGQEVSTIAAAT